MSGSVVTTVAAHLGPDLQKRIVETVRATAGVSVEVTELAPAKAIDVRISACKPELTTLLYRKLQELGSIDIFIQADDVFRRKRMLCADMDATIVLGETLDDLAAELGIKDKVAPITAAAMNGDIDFKQALEQRVMLLKGLPIGVVFEAVSRMEYAAGAIELVKTMRANGAHCVLISGGFDYFTKNTAEELGFQKSFGNRLEVENNRLTGRVHPPIVDKFFKQDTLKAEAAAKNMDLRHTMAVGDGANDIPMLATAGAGVGYFAKPAVVAATPFQVRYTDLTALLYMQGYRDQEIIIR